MKCTCGVASILFTFIIYLQNHRNNFKASGILFPRLPLGKICGDDIDEQIKSFTIQKTNKERVEITLNYCCLEFPQASV